MLGLAFLAGLSQTAFVGPAAADTMQRIAAGEPVRIGYANEPPYAFRGEQGADDGFMNAVARRVLRRMGVKSVTGIVAIWDNLLSDLEAGRTDLVTAGMYILPERCRVAAFSRPVGRFAEAFMVLRGNPLKLRGFADIKAHEAARMVTVSGYASVGFARAAGVPAARILTVNEPEDMVRALLLGRAQAASATRLALRYLAPEGKGRVEVVAGDTRSMPAGHAGFAFRKTDTAFREAFDRELGALIGTEAFLDLVRDYGYRPENRPDPAVTTASLCGRE